jgi:hypothetical protein
MQKLHTTLLSLENVKSIVVFLKVVKSVGSVANTNLNLSSRLLNVIVPGEQKRYVGIAGPVANYCSDMLRVVKRNISM